MHIYKSNLLLVWDPGSVVLDCALRFLRFFVRQEYPTGDVALELRTLQTRSRRLINLKQTVVRANLAMGTCHRCFIRTSRSRGLMSTANFFITSSEPASFPPKKFFRCPMDQIFGGVCSCRIIGSRSSFFFTSSESRTVPDMAQGPTRTWRSAP